VRFKQRVQQMGHRISFVEQAHGDGAQALSAVKEWYFYFKQLIQ